MVTDLDPANAQRDVVVLQSDRNYLFALAVTVGSLAEHHSSSDLRLAIAAEGFDEHDRQRIEALAGRHTVEWIETDPTTLDDIAVGPGLHRAALSRFLIPEQLPNDLARFLYLDVDVLVVGDLGDLLNTSLAADKAAAAVRDAYIGTFWGPKGPPLDLAPTDPSAPYFNAGVLLVDLERWRRERVAERCIDLLRRRRLRFIDQCAQNIVLSQRWKRLHPRWNLQSRHFAPSGAQLSIAESHELSQALDDPAIVHFTGRKPWDGEQIHPYAARWHSAAERYEVISPVTPRPTDRGWRQAARSLRTRGVRAASGTAGQLGVDLHLRRHTELRHPVSELVERTNSRVADGPLRGTALSPDTTQNVTCVRALLGLDSAGPARRSHALTSWEATKRAVVGEQAPPVVRAALPNAGFDLETIAHHRRRSSDAHTADVTLVVSGVTEFETVRGSPDEYDEAWLLVDDAATPEAVARVVAFFSEHFDVCEVVDPHADPHHHELFRDLGPVAASHMRAVLADRRRWIVAVRKSNTHRGSRR